MDRLKAAALRHFETTLIIIILLGIVAIAFLVQYKLAFLNFFFVPVILAGYYLGKRQAVLAACLCVLLIALYQIFFRLLLRRLPPFTMDDALNLVTWAGFLIITGAIIGRIAEQREVRLKGLERAYTGVLEIMLKYLEVADETQPRSVRLSRLAGKIAESIGLATFHVENIKSAALLLEAGDLKANLPLYDQVADFIGGEGPGGGRPVDDKARVLLKTTASLLKEVEPLLTNYFRHYVEEARALDKKLDAIPLGSSILALADIYDRLSNGLPLGQWKENIRSLEDIRKLSGRAFPGVAVEALFKVAAGAA